MSLVVTNLSVDHGAIRAISGVSFTVESGKIAAVIGSNGAGKTTLLRTLSGLKSASHGSAQWNQHDLFSVKPEFNVRHGIAHVGEGKSVIAELSVEENLHLGAIWRKDKKDVAAATNEVIELFPILGQRMSQSAGSLSGGERQMLAIGRALISNPDLILMDEPSEGLSPRFVLQVGEIIKRMRDLKHSILLVEQNLALALSVADYVYIISSGKFVFSGTPEELSTQNEILNEHLGVSGSKEISHIH